MKSIEDLKINKKGIKFICLNTTDTEIIELVSSVLIKFEVFCHSKGTVFVTSSDDIVLGDLIDLVNADLDLSLTLYESGKIYSIDDLKLLIDEAFNHMNHKGYLSQSMLIFSLKDENKLQNLKKAFLGSVFFNDDMKQFIKLFLENDLNASLSAKNGFMHRNTINYKLEQIFSETNLDIRKFKDAMAIYELLK